MKRRLLKQITNEWRENIWLVIELAVVFLVIWALVSLLYVETKGLRLPRGFDPDNVYEISTKYVKTDSPHFEKSEDNGYFNDLGEIVGRIQRNPNVESVTITNSYPYNYNYSGFGLTLAEEPDTIVYMGNRRRGTANYVDVFRLKSRTGATSEQLKEMLRKGEILISDNSFYEESGGDVMRLKGKKVILNGDSTKVYRVGDIIEKIRRNDYEDSFGGTIVMADEERNAWGNVLVRVKPGKGALFEEDFNNHRELRKQRNVYLTDLRPMSEIREANQRSIDIRIRTVVVVMLFLLMTIFLGLLGSFWFRMQQRVSEIAIRKVFGASRRDIFGRVLTEGMILLSVSVALVSACIWPFISTFEEMLAEKWYFLLMSECVAVVIVAVGIIVSLWYPARRAMNIEPADAIKAE